MIEAQKWLLHLCIACILVSVLSSFIKNEKVNTSIKSVLALYILVMTLNSVIGIDVRLNENNTEIHFETTQAVNPNDLVIKNAEQNICKQLNEKLAALKTKARCKAITLNIEMECVESVFLTENDEAATKAVKELLGDKITVVVDKEG